VGDIGAPWGRGVNVNPSALVDVGASTWLLDREIPFDRDPAGWPRTAPAGALNDAARLRDRLTRLISESPGYALIDLVLSDASDELLCRAAWNLLTTLCLPVPQYVTGEVFFPVEAADAQPIHSPFSMSRSDVAVHSDGTFLPAAPEIVALLSLSAADEGGETVIVDGAAVFDDLSAADTAVASLLLEEHPIDLRGQTNGNPTRSQPIATRDDTGRLRLRYVRAYIEQGYVKSGIEVSGVTRAAFDRFDALAMAEERQVSFQLKRGELLVIDNQRYLHGRRRFQEHARQRRLRRVYGMLR
jgi:alpha-ketoglutarate-dependent taurine dioxygenase